MLSYLLLMHITEILRQDLKKCSFKDFIAVGGGGHE